MQSVACPPLNTYYLTKLENYSLNCFASIQQIYTSRFAGAVDKCIFLKTENEGIIHLFCKCSLCVTFWKHLEIFV